jgi:hypothetical protein
MQFDAPNSERAAYRGGHPDCHLRGAHSIGLAKAASVLSAVALIIVRDERSNLRTVFRVEEVVQAHVLDRDIDRAHAVRATVVHRRARAVVLRAAFGLEGAAAAERAIVAWPDGVDALVCDVAHRYAAAEHKPYTRGHHVRGVAVVHVELARAASGEEERDRTPIGRDCAWIHIG